MATNRLIHPIDRRLYLHHEQYEIDSDENSFKTIRVSDFKSVIQVNMYVS